MLRESIQIGSFAGNKSRPATSNTRVHLCHDVRMALHGPPPGALDPPPVADADEYPNLESEDNGATTLRPECPERIEVCYKKLVELEENLIDGIGEESLGMIGEGLLDDEDEDEDEDGEGGDTRKKKRFLPVRCQPADRSVIELAHTSQHYDELYETSQMSDDELVRKSAEAERDQKDVVYSKETFQAARLAVGAVVSCVDAATSQNRGSSRAIALVRPPGHHATAGSAMGFCYFNSVVVGALHALEGKKEKSGVGRVAILDWDIHHGNGTQDLTYDDPNVMYVSLHRHQRGQDWEFYPGTGKPDEIGTARARGTNLNVAFTEGRMGDAEFAAAMSELVLPVLSAFHPDLILLSCGFDAAEGDPIGDCCVTPGGYHAMTRSVLRTVGVDVPIVAVLEGGYNLNVIPLCMEAVALALLDEPFEAPTVDANGLPSDLLDELFGELGGDSDGVEGNGDRTASTTERRVSAVAARRGTTCGRAELFRYWRHPEREGAADADIHPREGLGSDGNSPPPPNVELVAIRDINLSMRFLREAPMWKDLWKLRIVDLHDIPEPETAESEEAADVSDALGGLKI